MIGVGLSIVQLAVRQMLGGSAPWTPATLFSNSEPGVWYDPSDLTTLFQDSAGTTPVTAVEQPVGLMLDKSQGLVLGPELVTNGDFSDGATGWTVNSGWSIGGGVATKIAGAANYVKQGVPTVGKWYKVTFQITSVSAGLIYAVAGDLSSKSFGAVGTYTVYILAVSAAYGFGIYANALFAGSIDNISVRELPGNHATQTTSTSRPVLSARYNLLTNTETLSTQSVTTQATDYKLRFTGTGTITLSGTKTGVYTAGTHTLTGVTAGTMTLTVAGSVTQADIRPANLSASLPAYQRVNTETDYDTVGFPSGETFDGSDDYQTAPSGGGSTTAFFWCSAIMVRKVGSTQTLFSDTGTNTGYRVRINASNQLELSAGNGSAYTTVATTATLAYGQIAVLTAWHDGTNLKVQIDNGTVHQTAFATASAGTASLTIGRDNGAASSYAGIRLFEKVYLKNLVPSAGDIAKTKTYVGATAGMTI